MTAPTPDEVIAANDYRTMLESCIPTLRAELFAAEYMLAEMSGHADVQDRKGMFLEAAKHITGGLPPMTETALQAIAMSKAD